MQSVHGLWYNARSPFMTLCGMTLVLAGWRYRMWRGFGDDVVNRVKFKWTALGLGLLWVGYFILLARG